MVVEPIVTQPLEIIVTILQPHPQDFILGVEHDGFANKSADDVFGLEKGVRDFAESIERGGALLVVSSLCESLPSALGAAFGWFASNGDGVEYTGGVRRFANILGLTILKAYFQGLGGSHVTDALFSVIHTAISRK
ncbi:hypothetical protein [Pseudomonas baltica]|uniref:hypothetical protein n=1 Tax=Pseudomonas baltica TaxID=2762576 RepID=UPI0028A024B5|nr:hypothetical protein [Pseudomonas baltica]